MEPFEYRVESFEKLGFDRELSICLADSKDKLGVFVYHADVKKIIDLMKAKGMSDEDALKTAFGIYSDV